MRGFLLVLPIVLLSCSSNSPAPDAAANRAFLEKAAAAPGAIRTPSGLIYRELRPGTGSSPNAADTVSVRYRGTLVNGKEFDSATTNFPLSRVIPCWTEGLQRMKVGGTSQLVCPASIGYGDQGAPPDIPGGATLVFEIELLGVS